jgi:uncharacterized RDD family membrane protein YckC
MFNLAISEPMNWFYVEQGKQIGPVNDEQFNEMVRAGKIQPDTLVWREGMADWIPYRKAQSESNPSSSNATTFTSTEAPGEAVCVECGKMFPIDETIRYGNTRVCANCKPVFMQKLAEGAQIKTGELNYAGFGVRLAAKLVDSLIIGLPFFLVFFFVLVPQARTGMQGQAHFLTVFIQFGFMLIQMAYQIFFLGKYGATPGKMLCHLKVVTADGDRFGYGRATGRSFAEILSGLICYIGYIMIAFDGQKRALHDRICNTRVIYR